MTLVVILDTIQVYDGTGEKPTPGPAPLHLELATPWRWFGKPDRNLSATRIPEAARELRLYLPDQSSYADNKLLAKLQRAIGLKGSTLVLTHAPVEGKALDVFGRESFGPFTLTKVERKLGGYLPNRLYVWLTWNRDPLAGEKGYIE